MLNRTLGNRYQITEKIGMGGMAEVYKATDSTLGRTVAIKIMLPQYASDPTFAARFRQEAQAAANLSSPYIVNIYDWGRDDDCYYIVMEYVRGTDLKTAIQQRGNIHPRKVAEIGSQVCSALSVAHGYDIIHRDIKSANIMVQGDGNVKVMDFGIAEAGHPGMTQDSSVLGTAHYVSPEQAQGKKLGPTSDLYSLGIVLYEAATGQLPFDGSDVVSVAMKQVSDLPVPPRKINPNIDPQFEAIIMTALQKNPENRYATAKEMQRAIDDYLLGRSAAETVPLNNNAYSAAAATGGFPANQTVVFPNAGQTTAMPAGAYVPMGTGAIPPQKNSKKTNVIIAVLIALVIIAIGAFALTWSMSGDKITVPNIVGQTLEEAQETLQNADLKVGRIQYDISETVEKGRILRQDPQANTVVGQGTAITIVVSSGKTSNELVEVPKLDGKTVADANKELAAVGLVGEAKYESSDTVEKDRVIMQSIAAGSQVEKGTTIAYTVSSGKSTVSVPDVLGDSADSATSTLQSAGFNVNTVYETSNDYVGRVIDYSPRSEAQPGATITIKVGKEAEKPSQSSSTSKSSSSSSSKPSTSSAPNKTEEAESGPGE